MAALRAITLASVLRGAHYLHPCLGYCGTVIEREILLPLRTISRKPPTRGEEIIRVIFCLNHTISTARDFRHFVRDERRAHAFRESHICRCASSFPSIRRRRLRRRMQSKRRKRRCANLLCVVIASTTPRPAQR